MTEAIIILGAAVLIGLWVWRVTRCLDLFLIGLPICGAAYDFFQRAMQ